MYEYDNSFVFIGRSRTPSATSSSSDRVTQSRSSSIGPEQIRG